MLVQNTFNIVNEKTTPELMRALSNVYEKPSASYKIVQSKDAQRHFRDTLHQ